MNEVDSNLGPKLLIIATAYAVVIMLLFALVFQPHGVVVPSLPPGEGDDGDGEDGDEDEGEDHCDDGHGSDSGTPACDDEEEE